MWLLLRKSKKVDQLWTGSGWTQDYGLARLYEDPDSAQDMADALHLAGSNYDHEKARKAIADSKFVVQHAKTGEPYLPKPLVEKPSFIFARQGWQDRKKGKSS